MHFIEEEENGVLMKIEDISTWLLRGRKGRMQKFSRWREHTVLCFYFMGQSFVNSTIQYNAFCVYAQVQVEYLHTHRRFNETVHISFHFAFQLRCFVCLLIATVAMGPTPIKMQT